MKWRIVCVLLFWGTFVHAQTDSIRQGHDLKLDVEHSMTVSDGNFTPLWLSSNRYGLGSTEDHWNYLRTALHGDVACHNANWQLSYGVDVAAMLGCARKLAVTEAYFEAAWKRLYITAGSKKQPLMLKNERLTTGGLSYGINARPIPQIRIGAEYFSIPFTNGWWQWKGHLSYGWRTDGSWQKSWVDEGGKRTEATLYHEKCLYWKVGKHSVFPMDIQFGLQWATEFGGTAYNFGGRGYTLEQTAGGVKMDSGIGAYWRALVVGGSDVTDGRVSNTQGNSLGSWNVALTYCPGQWKIRAYGERYFDDISQLGLLYGISDHMFGLEVGLPKNPILSTVVVEQMNSRCQSGAIYHDKTPAIPDKMNGRDNYYNHHLYTGWQNYGMAMGNPLFISPLYNAAFGKEGSLAFYNTRIKAWHVGLAGNPTTVIDWRVLMTFTRNWGTYGTPFDDPQNQCYLMAEAGYAPKAWNGWRVHITVGLDHGHMLGNNTGGQLTVARTFDLAKP